MVGLMRGQLISKTVFCPSNIVANGPEQVTRSVQQHKLKGTCRALTLMSYGNDLGNKFGFIP